MENGKVSDDENKLKMRSLYAISFESDNFIISNCNVKLWKGERIFFISEI